MTSDPRKCRMCGAALAPGETSRVCRGEKCGGVAWSGDPADPSWVPEVGEAVEVLGDLAREINFAVRWRSEATENDKRRLDGFALSLVEAARFLARAVAVMSPNAD